MTAPPVGGDTTASSSTFSSTIDYRYRKSDTIFQGGSRTGNPSDVSTEFHQVLWGASHRISPLWIARVQVPFTDATRKESGLPDSRINGLGDVTVSTVLSPWAEAESAFENLTFRLGMILPTGEPRENPRTGEAAPSVFQLGTGTFQAVLGTRYVQTFGDTSLFASVDTTFPLHESSDDFRPGTKVFANIGAGHRLTQRLRAKLSMHFFHGTRDTFVGEPIGNTGSTTLSLTPSLLFEFNEHLRASASVSLPVFREVNETALAAAPLWNLGISVSF